MFANVEVISNNTYTFSNFTYEVPSSIKDKIKVGSVVQVTFRNKQLFGIVVKLNTETNIKKLNTITSISMKNLDQSCKIQPAELVRISICRQN